MAVSEHQRQTIAALSLALTTGLCAPPPVAAAVGVAPPALAPASTGGLEALDRALARLSSHRRLLVIAAHPDDEDTRLLTLVARGMGGEAAYLSLSRGEGGQNLIGAELGVGLGLLRSRELESARQVDGARQFFSRAYDFGYTRSLEETLAKWPKEVLLEDALRVARRFKPQVLVTVFPPSEKAGHGQHWAAGVVAAEAFELAGDAAALPQLRAEQLPPWRIEALYRATFFDRQATTLELPLGTLEPFSGKSIFQLSMASRSRHRSQDMGLLEPLGAAEAQLAWIAGAGGPQATDVFEGVDTRLAAIAELLPAGELRTRAAARLARVAELASATRRALVPAEPGRAAAPLGEIVGLLRALRAELAVVEGAGPLQARELIEEKLAIAGEALANAAGVIADATTDRETVVRGDRLRVSAVLWSSNGSAVGTPELTLGGSAAWELVASGPPPVQEGVFTTRGTEERILEVAVPPDASPTLPYFLTSPLAGALYDWSTVPAAVRGEPFQAPPLTVRFALTIAGASVELEREVVARWRDQAIGEVRRPLRVVPALELHVEPGLVVWPVDSKTEERLHVELRSNVERALTGHVEVAVPPGWPTPAPIVFELNEPHERRELEVSLRAPAGLVTGQGMVALTAVVGDERFGGAVALVDYPHVRPTPMPVAATVAISAADIHLPRLGRIGYVRGASDRVPEMLAAIGLPIEVLGPEQIVRGELSGFDAIVLGSRAYETEPALVEANGRLLDYVRAGGLAVIQYQQYAYTGGGFTPFPLEIRRPHDRITDETATARVLEPENAVFHHPNEIGATDWQGWVQERGLYFAGTWDPAYRPLLAFDDAAGVEQRGGLLVARLGAGTYVYTGLAFFRQLPAGVPGAYRLFANLLALAETSEPEPAQKLSWLRPASWWR